MTNKLRKILAINLSFYMMLIFTSCNLFKNDFEEMQSSFKGREAIIQTYDEDGNIIDSVEGKSIDIKSDTSFNMIDSNGNISSESSVLNITIGGNDMYHVGSSLILYDKELSNYFDTYQKTIDIENDDTSIPVVNRMINSFKNIWNGKSIVLFIRSQSGKPLATFAGDNVSIFSTEIDKTTGCIVDDKYLFIYKCDYTIYDTKLFK